jgi:hypothetical protein
MMTLKSFIFIFTLSFIFLNVNTLKSLGDFYLFDAASSISALVTLISSLQSVMTSFLGGFSLTSDIRL